MTLNEERDFGKSDLPMSGEDVFLDPPQDEQAFPSAASEEAAFGTADLPSDFDGPPMSLDALLADPHIGSLYRDEAYMVAYTSLTPLGEFAPDFADIESLAKGALNRLALSRLAGKSPDFIDLTYEGQMGGFSLSEFGRPAADDKELYKMISERARSIETARPSPVPIPGPRSLSAPASVPGPVPGPAPTPGPTPPPEKIDVSQMNDAERDALFRQQYPGLGPVLELIHGAVSFMEPFVQSNDDLAITPAEKYQQYQKTLARLAQLSTASFNPAGAVAQDDGKGHLVPNWEGLGSLGGGFLTGRFPVIFEGKKLIGLPSPRGAVPEVPVKAKWDPDTKAFHDENGSRLTDEEARLYRARKGPWIGVVNTHELPKGAHPERLWYDGTAREYRVGEKIVSAEEAAQIAAREREATGVSSRMSMYKVVDSSKAYPEKKLFALARYLERRGVQIMEAKKDCSFTAREKGPSTLKLNRYPTQLQVLHELCHYLDFLELGIVRYASLTRKERELRVLNRLKKNRIWNNLDPITQRTATDYANEPD